MARETLLTTGNPKTAKGEGRGYLTAILHLAPAKLSGRDVCPWRSPGCTAGCLNTAGRGGIIRKGETTNHIQECRKRRTHWLFEDRRGFLRQLAKEIEAHVRRSERHGLKPAVRLNGTSDLRWEKLAGWIFAQFPHVQFYDYTKSKARVLESLESPTWHDNYQLTFSRSETNQDDAVEVLEAGGNVAVVFDTGRNGDLPEYWVVGPLAFAVIDGDVSDLRFLDYRAAAAAERRSFGVVVGLRAKGKARRDDSGFVVKTSL